MGEGNDIRDDNVCSGNDVCKDHKAKCEDRRKWKNATNVLRELEEGCDIRIGKLRQMMDAMVVEKHVGLVLEEEETKNLDNIHFVAFLI